MENSEIISILSEHREKMMKGPDGSVKMYGDLDSKEQELYNALSCAMAEFYEKDDMTRVVVVKHFGDNGHYLFSVPRTHKVKEGDTVLVRNKKGETTARCVCDSFEVQESVLKALATKYGATLPLASVIGLMRPEWW